MSTKKPDVLISPPSPMTAMSLAEMHIQKWEMIAQCGRCGLAIHASLVTMIKVYGPDTIWWGMHPPCPGVKCDGGKLTYSVRSIRGGSWVVMNEKPREQYVKAWKDRRGWMYPGPR